MGESSMKTTETAAQIDIDRWSNSTAAPSFHLSDTLDWSSLAAQIKNQVIVIPNRRMKIVDQLVQPLVSKHKGHPNSED